MLNNQPTPAQNVLNRLLDNLFKFPSPGRFNWLLVLGILILGLWSIVRSAPSQDELLKMLSLLAFTASIAFSDSRMGWPRSIQRPLAFIMLIIGGSLMFFWIFMFNFVPSFNVMALLFGFAMAMRETRTLFMA